MTMSTRSRRPLRSRLLRLLPGQALVRARPAGRPVLRPTSIADPAEHQAHQATWLQERALRSHRRKIASRFAMAISVAAMVLTLFFLSMQTSNPLERAQMAQTAQGALKVQVAEPTQWVTTEETARPGVGDAMITHVATSRL